MSRAIYPVKVKVTVEKDGVSVDGEIVVEEGKKIPAVQSLVSRLLDKLCEKLGVPKKVKKSRKSSSHLYTLDEDF